MMSRKEFYTDKLKVEVYSSAVEMGKSAAVFVAGKLKAAIQERNSANLILGTGASQYPLHDALIRMDIEWQKINLFHLDEYIGINDNHPASFRRFLRERIAEKVLPGSVHYINGDADDLNAEIKRYELLLRENKIDVACIGIGENGHIAFNDPGVADFKDPVYLKVVEMDEACRRQQVGEGWFPALDSVPGKAVTLTVTAIMDCKCLCCTVPDERKSDAVYNALLNEISTSCPASVLRLHGNAVLFLDRFAAKRLHQIQDI
jgi:glucosamine-6-phosphate deaminase